MTWTQPRPYRAGETLGVAGGVGVVVLQGVDAGEDVACGGETLVGERPVPRSATAPQSLEGVRPGDVLWDPATGLEIRCVRGGPGPLLHGGRAMVLRARAGHQIVSPRLTSRTMSTCPTEPPDRSVGVTSCTPRSV
jgi:hypothetical protein